MIIRELSKEEKEELVKRTKDALIKLENILKNEWNNFDLELLDIEVYNPGYESRKEKLILMFSVDREKIIVMHSVNHYIEEEGIVENFIDYTSSVDHFVEFGYYKNKGIESFEFDICEIIASYFDVIRENIESQIKGEIERLNNLLKKIQ